MADESYKALSMGRASDAIEGYTKVLATKKLARDLRANALLNRGLAYQQTKNFAEAVDDYSEALKGDVLPDSLRPTAYYNRGLAFQKLGRLGNAVEDFTSALFEQPDFSHAYYARGNALRDSGQLLFALSDFEKAMRYRYPHPHLIHYSEALAFQDLRRPDEAAKSLRLALEVKPGFEPARKLLAELEQGGRPSDEAKLAVPEGEVIVVGSIDRDGDDQIVRKVAMPKAVEPPEALAADDAARRLPAVDPGEETASIDPAPEVEAAPKPRKKLYTDRILPSEDVAAVLTKAVDDGKIPEIDADVKDVAPPEPEAKAEPAVQPTGWTIQISSAVNEDLAWGVWKKLKARHKILADQDVAVIKADLGDKGTFYRVKLQGFDDVGSAKAMCLKLKSRGIKCFVAKAQG